MRLRNRASSLGNFSLVILTLVLSLVLTGVAPAQNPVPLINQPLVPDAVKPGGPGFTLTVNGTGFVSGSAVHWNGSARDTTFVNSSKLKVSILASDITKASTASVTVANPRPGGGISNAVFFEVAIPTPAIALTKSAFSVGVSPSSVATGDFNNDGKLDLAVANSADDGDGDTVSILLGNGDGTFRPAVNYSVGGGAFPGPSAVAVGDFKNDGKLDLVVTNSNSGSVAVLLGNGDGTFRAAVNYGVGIYPISVVVGDFDGDGKLDVATANVEGGVSVLLGNGDGTFQTGVTCAVGSTPSWVAVGDFNRDGKLDLVVANSGSNNVSVLLGNGDGTFQAAVNYDVGTNPTGIAVADFNGDGKLDLAVTNLGSNNISVLLGNGDGTFRAAMEYGAGSNPVSVAVGDFNGDNKLDLVVTNNNAYAEGTPSVSLLLGKGNGTFETAVDYYSVGSTPESVAVGDFDRDGKLDMAVADAGGTTVYVLSTSFTFADQLLGSSSPTQPVWLTNYGTSALNITSIGITGADAEDFAHTNTCGSSLAPRASCTIDVTFTPEEIGGHTATLSIADGAAGSPQTVSLKGAGTVVELVPSSLDLGGGTITLTNTGSTTLGITGIAASGNGFSQTNDCGSSVKAGKSCTISVTFTPPGFGLFIGTISVSDDGGGSPQQVSLSARVRFI